MNKKTLSVILLLFFALSVISYAQTVDPLQAKLDFYQGKIKKIQNYIKTLEAKTAGATGKDRDRINKEIGKQYERIDAIKNTMVGIMPVEQPPVIAPAAVPQPKPTLAVKGLIGEAGYAAGAGALGASYVIPLKEKMAIRPGAQYLIGKNYSVMLIQAVGDYYLNPETHVGLSVDYASYSAKVKSIPGIGETTKGGNLGFGLIAAKKLGKYEVQFGYSTVLGIILLGGYCF